MHGVNLAFFSGNEVYWKTRWEASEDGSSTPDRTLVCYKDTWADTQIDPVDLDLDLARSAVRRRKARERTDRHRLHVE